MLPFRICHRFVWELSFVFGAQSRIFGGRFLESRFQRQRKCQRWYSQRQASSHRSFPSYKRGKRWCIRSNTVLLLRKFIIISSANIVVDTFLVHNVHNAPTAFHRKRPTKSQRAHYTRSSTARGRHAGVEPRQARTQRTHNQTGVRAQQVARVGLDSKRGNKRRQSQSSPQNVSKNRAVTFRIP